MVVVRERRRESVRRRVRSVLVMGVEVKPGCCIVLCGRRRGRCVVDRDDDTCVVRSGLGLQVQVLVRHSSW